MFNDLFKDYIANAISTEMAQTITEGTIVTSVLQDVSATNDYYFNPLEKNSDSVIAVFTVPQSSRTNVAGVDMTTQYFNIRLLCRTEKKKALFQALQNISDANNAIFQNLSNDTESYNVQMQFNTPFTNGIPTDAIQTIENGVKKRLEIVNVTWIIRTTFSNNVMFGARSLKLYVSSAEYPINGIIRYSFTEKPNSAISQQEGNNRATYHTAVVTTTYVIVMQELVNDTLHQLLMQELTDEEKLYHSALYFKIGDADKISISDYEITHEYVDGTSIYSLTLIK